MSITENKNAFVDPTGAINLAQMFTVTGTGGNPVYLVLTMLDRNEYTRGATGATGSLSGNGHQLSLVSLGGDQRGAGVVFTYQPTTGRYFNTTLGYFDQLTYTASGSAGDVTNLSVFGTSNFNMAFADAPNAYALIQDDAGGYLGSATVVTQPNFSGTVPTQATPNSIASIANGFVGQTWNSNGCWVLTSTIAADAGASLPVQSSLIDIPGQSNGEWIVAFNGPAGSQGNWQAMVTAGEIIVIGTPGGGGHITTCVSGSGSTAMLVDNAVFLGASGAVQNSANDGFANDIIIAAPHAASQEWAGVQAFSVVIYELDTPIVTPAVASASLGYHTSMPLGVLFSAADPAGKTITQWQIYDTAASDALVMNGVTYSGHSDTSALSTTSLNAVSLVTGSTTTNDNLEVRAYNGTYWGDWQSLAVSVAPSAPALVRQTQDQTWTGGKAVSLTLPASTFTDPQGQSLGYAATSSNGQALPGWLNFNPMTNTFGGTAPSTPQNLSVTVTATDTSGLSASETFSAAILPPPPGITLSGQTPDQIGTDGQSMNLVLPASVFIDALGLQMTFAAYEANGPDVTSWLHFDPATETISGIVPANERGTIGLAVIARDARNVMAADMFNVAFAGSTGLVTAEIAPAIFCVDPTTNAPSPFGLMALHS